MNRNTESNFWFGGVVIIFIIIFGCILVSTQDNTPPATTIDAGTNNDIDWAYLIPLLMQ